MNELHYGQEVVIPRERSTAGVFGWVMGLVGISIVFLALGAYVGRDFSRGAALACSIGAFGMLMVQSFGGARFRVGRFAIGWLFALAALLGMGAGPMLQYYVSVERGVVFEAALGTAATVIGMGALGLTMSKDLVKWMRPVSLIVFAACIASWVWVFVAGSLSPVVSIIIFAVSALLLVIDFNYIRKHATEDDVVWLATGIFVSIINIFFSLLNLLDN